MRKYQHKSHKTPTKHSSSYTAQAKGLNSVTHSQRMPDEAVQPRGFKMASARRGCSERVAPAKTAQSDRTDRDTYTNS